MDADQETWSSLVKSIQTEVEQQKEDFNEFWDGYEKLNKSRPTREGEVVVNGAVIRSEINNLLVYINELLDIIQLIQLPCSSG
jgi:hypothetical protein